MAGGGAGAGNGSEVFNGAQAPDSTMADDFGRAQQGIPQSLAARLATVSSMPNTANTQTAYTPSPQSSDYYNSLIRPNSHVSVIEDAYRNALGRNPTATEQQSWSQRVANYGTTGQNLANQIQQATAAERAQSGYQSTLNPSGYTAQHLGRPSYYNTNPIGVDYANIFNPAAQSVISNQQTLTPQQQSDYLSNWAQKYSANNRAATDAANLERKNTANAQWEKYLTEKAKAEAAAPDAINKAVEEKLTSMGYGQNSYSGDSNSGWYTGKAGGSVPGGLRSLKGKTKP